MFFKKLEGDKSEDAGKFSTIFRFVVHTAGYGGAAYLYYTNNQLESQSMLA